MHRCRFVLLALVLLPLAAVGREAFLDPADAFRLSVADAPDGGIELRWQIASGYYLYRHAFSVEGEDAPVADVRMPEGQEINDEYFGRQEVYFDTVALQVDPGRAERLRLSWQGCAKAGLCYPPQETTVAVPGDTDDPGNSAADTASTPGDRGQGDDQRLAEALAQWGPGWVLAAFFGMGLLLTFTPCVLPMLPILSSLIVGAEAGPRRGLVLSAAYIAPMALTYAALGVAAGLAGANLQAVLQAPVVLIPFAALFVVLALAMFGAFELQLPQPIRSRLDAAQRVRGGGGSLGGAAVMGVLSALLVGPCMTALLAGALLYIADTGDAAIGGLALFALGLGMGTPLLVAGTCGARFLPKPGAWMNRVKVLFGFVLLAMAVWFLARIAAPWVTLILWAVWLLAAAVALWGAVASSRPRRGVLDAGARVIALVAGIWAAAMLLGAAAGHDDPWQPLAGLSVAGSTDAGDQSGGFMARFEPVASRGALRERIEQAASRGRWTVVDVYADWCTSCKVIEEEVFGDPAVQDALAGMQLLRPDVTDNNAADRRLLSAHDILGPPTILLIGPDGEERRAQRIIGELSAGAFLERLAAAKGEG